ncbi:hypothetical protein ACXZ1M_01000 [Duganella sp. PWIR1]
MEILFEAYILLVMITVLCGATLVHARGLGEMGSQPLESAEKEHLTTKDIVDIYAKSELDEIPAVVPMTSEQQQYVLSLIASTVDVIEQNRELSEKDPVFGGGAFFWPKNPQQPAKSKITYRPDNFKFQSITIGFSRENSQRPWSMAGFAIHPRNFPDGVFGMKLPKEFFSKLIFEKAYAERREHAALTEVNVFLYKLQRSGKSMTLQFDARPDVSNIQDQHPQSFHNLVIYSGDRVASPER